MRLNVERDSAVRPDPGSTPRRAAALGDRPRRSGGSARPALIHGRTLVRRCSFVQPAVRRLGGACFALPQPVLARHKIYNTGAQMCCTSTSSTCSQGFGVDSPAWGRLLVKTVQPSHKTTTSAASTPEALRTRSLAAQMTRICRRGVEPDASERFESGGRRLRGWRGSGARSVAFSEAPGAPAHSRATAFYLALTPGS